MVAAAWVDQYHAGFRFYRAAHLRLGQFDGSAVEAGYVTEEIFTFLLNTRAHEQQRYVNREKAPRQPREESTRPQSVVSAQLDHCREERIGANTDLSEWSKLQLWLWTQSVTGPSTAYRPRSP